MDLQQTRLELESIKAEADAKLELLQHQPDIFSDIECTWACELKSTAKHGKVRQSTAKRRAIMNGAGTAPCNNERRRYGAVQ